MKKFILSTIVILAFIGYALSQNMSSVNVSVPGVTNSLPVLNKPTASSTNPPVNNSSSAKSKPVVRVPVVLPVPVTQSNRIGDDNENDSENSNDGNFQSSVVPILTPTPVTTPVPVTPTPVMPTPVPVPVVVNNGKYRNGTYTGSNEYAYSDYIQVSAVISGGKLTDVQFPSSTGGPGRSKQIYAFAMPQLKSEAISAQSANIDTVSGATYTSSAFQKSLSSALAQAIN